MSQIRRCVFCFVASGVLASFIWVPWGALEVFEFKTVDVRMWLREQFAEPRPQRFVRTLVLDDAALAARLDDAARAELQATLHEALGPDPTLPDVKRPARVVGVELPAWHSVATPLLEDFLLPWWDIAPDLKTRRLVVGLQYGVQGSSRDSQLPRLEIPVLAGPAASASSQPAFILAGDLDLAGDHDGVVRRVPLVVPIDGQLVPSFVLQLVCAHDGVDVRDARIRLGHEIELVQGATTVRSIPIDAQGRFILNSRERPPGTEISVRELVSGAATLPDTPVVLLGTSARRVSVFHNGPLGGRRAEVALAAEALETILAGDTIRRVGRTARYFIVWALLLVGSIGMVHLASWRGVVLGFAIVLAYIVFEKLLFVWFSVWLDIVLPVIALSWGAAVFPVYGFRARSKRLVNEMRLLRRFDDMVLMNIAGGLVVANRNGVVVRHNPRASALLGMTGESLHGRHVRDLFAISPATLEIFTQVMGAHPHEETTLPISRRVALPPDGDTGERVFELGVSLVDPDLLRSPAQSDLPCYVLSFDDVTQEVQEAHAESRRARLTALGEIAAKLGHEFRNSLGGMRLFIEHVRDEISPDSPGARSIDAAIREIKSLYHKIDELRQYGLDPQLELAACDLKDLLEEALAFASQKLSEKHVRVVLECEKGMPPVHVDRRQLREAFQNLINNAIEAAPEGGRIAIRAEHLISSNGAGPETFVVHVEDNGPGISEIVQEQMFSLFFTTKPDIGTGLGLPIVKKIVESHGGRLTFDCGNGGTVFTVILPAPRGMQEVQR